MFSRRHQNDVINVILVFLLLTILDFELAFVCMKYSKTSFLILH